MRSCLASYVKINRIYFHNNYKMKLHSQSNIPIFFFIVIQTSLKLAHSLIYSQMPVTTKLVSHLSKTFDVSFRLVYWSMYCSQSVKALSGILCENGFKLWCFCSSLAHPLQCSLCWAWSPELQLLPKSRWGAVPESPEETRSGSQWWRPEFPQWATE